MKHMPIHVNMYVHDVKNQCWNISNNKEIEIAHLNIIYCKKYIKASAMVVNFLETASCLN